MASVIQNGNRWIRVTTNQKNINDAKEVARELYTDAHYRLNHGIPAQSKRFKDVAKLAIDRMGKAKRNAFSLYARRWV